MAIRALNYEQGDANQDDCKWTLDDDEEDFGAAATKLEERMWPHVLCTLCCVHNVLCGLMLCVYHVFCAMLCALCCMAPCVVHPVLCAPYVFYAPCCVCTMCCDSCAPITFCSLTDVVHFNLHSNLLFYVRFAYTLL